MKKETVVFGGGCFWCTEAVFQRLRGVIEVIPGYSGGDVRNPAYHEVAEGSTGHAEVIKIIFDPSTIKFRQLLEVFFAVHDPTSLNRQGNDTGTQYRSVIFYMNESQRKEARKYIDELTKSGDCSEIVTEILPLADFYDAESFHRNYYNNNTEEPYCSLLISPKLEKLRETFPELVRE